MPRRHDAKRLVLEARPAGRGLAAHIPGRWLATTLFLGAALSLAACGGDHRPKDDVVAPSSEGAAKVKGKLFGEDGLTFGGPDDKRLEEEGGSGIGVNSFLWRASLDTIAFMPVASADPFGGVIITDWHSPNAATAERFKMNIYILGRALRADGVRVSVFRQVIDQTGQWRDAPVANDAATKIENSVLTRARQLRNQSLTKK